MYSNQVLSVCEPIQLSKKAVSKAHEGLCRLKLIREKDKVAWCQADIGYRSITNVTGPEETCLIYTYSTNIKS